LGLLAAGHTAKQVAHGYDIPLEAVQEALGLAGRVFDRYGDKLTKRT
jgi:uncharacterized protein (DUF433 family)